MIVIMEPGTTKLAFIIKLSIAQALIQECNSSGTMIIKVFFNLPQSEAFSKTLLEFILRQSKPIRLKPYVNDIVPDADDVSTFD